MVLRHHLEDHCGLIGESFEARGYEIDLRMMDGEHVSPSLEGYDTLVILGSKSAVYDREVEAAWFGRELELIAEAERRSIPILGICFGAQALCLYHGGRVEPSTDPEIGWYDIEATNDSGLSSGPWFEFHFDHCILPEKAVLWARSPRAVQAFAVGRHVGVQFHPEIDHLQLLERTAAETPAARGRAHELVGLFLGYVGL